MRSRKIIAMVMTFLMMLSLLPSLVFASAVPSGELGGKLKIKGTAAVGSELSADYTKVTPEGLSDDYVSFSWSRKTGDQLTEVGTEKTYKLTADDLGNKIQLKITGKSELGVTGELKANTVEIVATPEEAPQETTEDPDAAAAQDTAAEDSAAEDIQQAEDAQPAEDTQDEVIDIGGEPEASADEMQPAENQTAADTTDTSDSAADSADAAQPADTATDDSVIDIGTEDYLEIPEEGQSNDASEADNAQDAQAPEEVSYAAEAAADTASEDGTAVVDFGTVDAGFSGVQHCTPWHLNTAVFTLAVSCLSSPFSFTRTLFLSLISRKITTFFSFVLPLYFTINSICPSGFSTVSSHISSCFLIDYSPDSLSLLFSYLYLILIVSASHSHDFLPIW